MYRCFTRSWYKKENKKIVPNYNGRKYTIDTVGTEKEAKEICKDWNEKHEPGVLSKKCEYMKI